MPGGRSANRYPPWSSLTAVRTPMIAGPVSDRLTPGSTAPEGSVILPVMTPSCAHEVPVIARVNSVANVAILRTFIAEPPAAVFGLEEQAGIAETISRRAREGLEIRRD